MYTGSFNSARMDGLNMQAIHSCDANSDERERGGRRQMGGAGSGHKSKATQSCTSVFGAGPCGQHYAATKSDSLEMLILICMCVCHFVHAVYKPLRMLKMWKLPKACRQGTRNRRIAWSGLSSFLNDS